MQRVNRVVISAVMIVALAGCGGSGGQDQSAQGTADEKRAQANEPGPDVAVFDFLEAVRAGDEEKANGMLTQLAREKTAELDMVVAPPGSETASFEVGEVELLGEGGAEDGAHVSSRWTDLDEDSRPHTDEITWMLRREPQGWRIAGMSTKIFEDDLPLLLNFEDPEDMVRKQRLAEEEMERRARPATAQSPPAAARRPARQ